MFKIFAAALALCLASGAASAATLSVFSADCDPNFDVTGLASAEIDCPTLANRQDSSAVNLGAADKKFYSLGLGGAIVFRITPAFTGPATVVEVTNPSNHREAADVLGSVDGTIFTLLGTVANATSNTAAPQGLTASLTFSGSYNFLAFVDVSRSYFTSTGSQDGFDLDAFTVTPAPAPVPLPAAAFLLLGGLGALGLLRRRQTAT